MFVYVADSVYTFMVEVIREEKFPGRKWPSRFYLGDRRGNCPGGNLPVTRRAQSWLGENIMMPPTFVICIECATIVLHVFDIELGLGLPPSSANWWCFLTAENLTRSPSTYANSSNISDRHLCWQPFLPPTSVGYVGKILQTRGQYTSRQSTLLSNKLTPSDKTLREIFMQICSNLK